MTNERKGHRMVGENVNNSSPKRKPKVAGIGHILSACSGLHRETAEENLSNEWPFNQWSHSNVAWPVISSLHWHLRHLEKCMCSSSVCITVCFVLVLEESALKQGYREWAIEHFLRTWLSLFILFFIWAKRRLHTNGNELRTERLKCS